MFFSELFVCMRLCGCRVSKVVSYALSHGIPSDFSTLQYNITSYDVMLRHFRSSYLRPQYIVLVCVVINGFVRNVMVRCASFCIDMLCYVMSRHAIAFSKWYALKLSWTVVCSVFLCHILSFGSPTCHMLSLYVELDYVSLHFKMYVFVVSCCTATLDVIQTII